MTRSTWLDILLSMAAVEEPLTPPMREALIRLDEALFDFWRLGEKIVLVWTRSGEDFRFLGIPHYDILKAGRVDFMNALLAGPKFVPPEDFQTAIDVLASGEVVALELEHCSELPVALVDSLVTRYGVTLVRERAVVLLDAVGFSLHEPLAQVAMLNSLSYSVNSAYSQLASKDIQINFARTTTGDGFYIWNRSKTRDANIALYKLMMLLLADNAVAHRKAIGDFPVPRLRAAFHIGEHYEFYQVEALNPTTFGYIVGPVTIDLARMLSNAPAEQIIMGKFEASFQGRPTDTMAFVDETASTLAELTGLAVAGDRIRDIRCYLTGPSLAGGFRIASYDIRDKHGLTHSVYNAKINIHLHRGEPIFLGVQHKDVQAA